MIKKGKASPIVGTYLMKLRMHAHTMVMMHGNLLIFFFEGLTINMKQILESLCNGKFLTKSRDEALE